MTARWLVAIACVGCGGAPRSIPLAVDGSPIAVWYRDGSGPWQHVPLGQPFVIQVTDDYQVVATCEDPSGAVATQEQFGTIADAAPQVHWPDAFAGCAVAAPAAQVMHVVGDMVQPGTVYAGNQQQMSTLASWPFDLIVTAGTRGLIATDGQRAVLRADNTSTGPIDLASGLAVTPIAVTADDSDATYAAFLQLDDTVAYVPPHGSGSVFPLVEPPDLGDAQEKIVAVVTRDASSYETTQSVTHVITADAGSLTSVAVTLPPAIPRITYAATPAGAIGVDVPGIPLTQATVSMTTLEGSGTTAVTLAATASAAWLDAHDDRELDVATPDDFPAGWIVDTSVEYARQLEIDDMSGGDSSSTIEQDIAFPSM